MVDTTGFVTSLVINGAIALIALAAFVILRPRYPWCYDTRRNPKRRVVGTEPPTAPPGLFAWLPKMMQLTDAQVLSTAGLDGLMYIKFFEMNATLFAALCVLGIGILLPVNVTSENDIIDAFDKMSMSNIPTGNRRFWAHLLLAYLFCATFYYLAWHTWKSYMNYRHQHLARWTLLGGNHTIMIHELPVELRSDAALLAHFSALYPGQVRSARMAKDLRMDAKEKKQHRGENELASLEENVAARDAVVQQLEHDLLAWEKQQADKDLPEEKRIARPQTATKMLCCGKVDAIDHHYAELQRLNRIIAAKQAQIAAGVGGGASAKDVDAPSGDKSEGVPTLLSGFVTFHSARTAVSAARAFVYDTRAFSFDVKAAPELRDVYWPSLNFSKRERSLRSMLFNVITGALCVFWMIPMGFLMGVANLSGLAEKYSWLSGVNDIPSVILGFIEAYLPAVLLSVFFSILPLILLWFSKEQGIEAHSWLQRSVIHKYFLFMVLNFFFGAIVGGAIFSNITELVSDINGVPSVLGRQIPGVATYFVTYVGLAAFAGFPLQLLQPGRLIVGGLKKKYLALTTREFEAAEAAPLLDYGVAYCPHLFIFLVSITYCVIAPIIIPFAAIYFTLGWLVQKYMLVHVYVQKFESGGVFWPVAYSKMSSSLLIAQVCLVGIFGLKEVPAQAALVVPLPFLTLLFDRYVHNAIKEKLVSLPLPQLLEIDALRKAERMLREKEASGDAAVPSSDDFSKAKEEKQLAPARPSGVSEHKTDIDSGALLKPGGDYGSMDMDIELAKSERIDNDPVSARASARPKTELQYEQRGEQIAPASTPALRMHVTPRAVAPASQNGVTGSTRSYLVDEERNEPKLVLSHKAGTNLPQLGFPYRDNEQERAWVEGDVPAYVQPELTEAVPAEVIVDGASEQLSQESRGDGPLRASSAEPLQIEHV